MKNIPLYRIIAIPFIFMVIWIRYTFHALKHSWLVLMYGGEWITYYKSDRKTIQDIYLKLIEDNKSNNTI